MDSVAKAAARAARAQMVGLQAAEVDSLAAAAVLEVVTVQEASATAVVAATAAAADPGVDSALRSSTGVPHGASGVEA